MSDLFKAGMRFEALVGKIFEAHRFRVITPANDFRLPFHGPDFTLVSRSSVKTIVEVKFIRSRGLSIRDIERAASQLMSYNTVERAQHALIVTNLRNSQLPPEASWPSGIMLAGFEHLVAWSANRPELTAELYDIDSELGSALKEFEAPGATPPPSQANLILQIAEESSGLDKMDVTPPSTRGEELAQELLAIPTDSGARRKSKFRSASGQEALPWQHLEKTGQSCLEYAFEGMLGHWQRQKAVGGDASRYDVLAKVIGNDVFSRMLVQDFRTRYILFEFKNYKDQIEPNLIHVTEKYLYPTALRATAVIVSRSGFTANAVAATHGALRETGKLILGMDRGFLAELVRQKDRGNTPELRMEAMLDQFLQQVGR